MIDQGWWHFSGYEAFARLREEEKATAYSLIKIPAENGTRSYLPNEDGRLAYLDASAEKQEYFDPNTVLSDENAPDGWDIRFPEPQKRFKM